MSGTAQVTPTGDTTIYTVGGAVGGGQSVYLPRQADADLLALCRAGAFAYVLAPRQLGKSSLTLHTAAALAADGIRPVLIDLTAIGTRVTAEAWYFGLLYEIADQLELETDLLAWWQAHEPLSLAQRFTRFFHELVLPTLHTPVVVFVDEIDTTLSLDFTDDFFAAIRSFHDARTFTPALARLSFVLIGVATPGDLIQDPRRTPFNIGQRVEMTDFSFEEARPLAAGLGLPPAEAEQVLAAVLAWTSGHPYLTQRLCQAITEEARARWDVGAVRAVVERIFLGSGSSQDNNLQFVRDMLTKRAPDPVGVLTTYRAIRQGTHPVFDEEQSLVKSHLKLAGIVRREGATLRVRNLIYRTVFDNRWVRDHLPPALNWVPWLRRALVALGGLFVITVIGLGLLAEAQRRDADAARTLAEARELAIRAQAAGDPEVSLLLATEAARRLQTGQMADTSGQITQVLLDALGASHIRQRLIHPAAVTSVAWTNWQGLVTTSLDGQARIWPAQAAGAVPTPMVVWATTSVPLRVRGSPDGAWIATAEADGTVQIWDAAARSFGSTPTARLTLRGHSGEVLDLAFSPDSRSLVTASRDNTAIIWDLQTGQARQTLRGHSSWVRSAAWSPDGRLIITASADTTARIWDAASGANIRLLQGHIRDVRRAAWSPDGRLIVTAGEDKTARVWNAADGTTMLILRGHTAEVTDAAWSPDGRAVATASRDGTVKLWDAANGQEQLTLQGHSGEVDAVAWSSDGQRLATAGADGTARVWQVAAAPERLRLDDLAALTTVVYRYDGQRLLTAAQDGSLATWNIDEPMSASLTWQAHAGVLRAAAWSPDGRWIITAHDDTTARLWDAATGQPGPVLRGHHDPVLAAAWSPDSRRVVTAGADRTAQIWDAANGQMILVLAGHTAAVRAVAWSPDGRWIVTGSEDGTTRTWNAITGQARLVLRPAHGGVNGVGVAPDGRRIVTAYADGTAQIWDAASGQPGPTLDEAGSGLSTIAWSPDGRWIAAPRQDGTTTVWEADSGREHLLLHGSTAPVEAVAWSPDGRFLVTAGAAGSVRQYALNLADLLALVPARLTRSLTAAEWEQFGLAPTPTPLPAATPPPALPTDTPRPSPRPLPTASAAGLSLSPVPPPSHGLIAFASNRGDPLQSHLYIMNATGADQHALTTAPLYNLYPAWSPDGTQLVYVGADPHTASDSPAGDLYVLRADGSDARQLTHGLNAKWPKWSPDGRWIVYADAPENQAAAYDLYLLRLADGTIRRLTDTPGFDGMPAWTPDGQIVFAGARGDQQDTHLYIMNADGAAVRPMTGAPGWQDSPAVAPNGQRVAFVSTHSGAERIYTMALDGSDLRVVTDGPGVDRYPSWSPDGQWLAFHSNRADRTNFEIYIVPAAGGTAQRLTTDAAFDDEPAWQP